MLDPEWLNTFAAVGLVQESERGLARWQPVGACVFVARHELMWLVTANHIIPPEPAPKVAVRIDVNDTPQLVPLWAIQATTPGIGWVRDHARGLAACLMPNVPGSRAIGLPREAFAPEDMELTSMTCLTGGCPLGLPGLDPARAMPVVLDGIVAGVDPVAKRLFLTAPTYPGNSGGPVFVERPPHDSRGNLTVGGLTTFLAGVVQSTGSFDAPGYERPLHLGVAAHIQQVVDLLESADAHKQAVIARGIG